MRVTNEIIKNTSIDPGTGALLINKYGPIGFKCSIGPWECGLNMQTFGRFSFEEVHADLSLLSLPESQLDDPVLSSIKTFLAAIPEELSSLVKNIAYGQLQALQILSVAGDPAIELMKEGTIFFWLLAVSVMNHTISLDRAAELVRERRIETIKILLPEAAKRHLKLLSQVSPVEFNRDEYAALEALLSDERLQENLKHCHHIMLPLVQDILDSPNFQSMPCIHREISDPHSSMLKISMAKRLYKTCLRLGRQGGVSNVEQHLRKCSNMKELHALTTKWHGKYNEGLKREKAFMMRENEEIEARRIELEEIKRKEAEERRARELERARRERELELQRQQRIKNSRNKFPAPPIPGNEFIIPIKSYSGLVREGRTMNHCVATYRDSVLAGDSYIYQVLYPQRYTLEILCRGPRRIGEFKGKDNVKPSKEARAYVRKWLAGNNKKLK